MLYQYKKTSLAYDKSSSTLQSIKVKSSDLQKLLGYLNGTVTSMFKNGTFSPLPSSSVRVLACVLLFFLSYAEMSHPLQHYH